MTTATTEAPAKWGFSFAKHGEPDREVFKRSFIVAETEDDARVIAWRQAEAQGITTATHLIRKGWRHKGPGFAGGHGLQRQDLPRAESIGTATVLHEAAPLSSPTGGLEAMIASVAEAAAKRAVAGIEARVNPAILRGIVEAAITDATTRTVHVEVQGRPPVTLTNPHPLLDKVLSMVATPKPDGTRINVELVGPAGCGKTHLARDIAKVLSLPFLSTSLTSGVDESELVGSLFPTMNGEKYIPSAFVGLYKLGGVFLGDEWDAADANVRLRLNQALANGHLPTPNGEEVVRHKDNIILAASNTWGHGGDRAYCGRQAQDEASNDRFIQIEMDYDEGVESTLIHGHLADTAMAEALHTEWKRIRQSARRAKLQKPVSMRKVVDLAHLLHVGAFSSLKEAIKNATAGWSVAERAAVQV